MPMKISLKKWDLEIEILWDNLFLIWEMFARIIWTPRSDCQRDPISNHLEHDPDQASEASDWTEQLLTWQIILQLIS